MTEPKPPKAEPPSDRPARKPAEPAQAQSVTCDLCGNPTFELHCRIICNVCGYQRDCSDP